MLQYELDRVMFLRENTVALSERLGLIALQSIIVVLFVISYYIVNKLQHV